VVAEIVVRPAAESDISDAVDYYLLVAPTMASDLTYEIDKELKLVAKFLHLYPAVYGDNRRIALKKFPYLVWYRYVEELDAVIVFRVTHNRRNPVAIHRTLP